MQRLFFLAILIGSMMAPTVAQVVPLPDHPTVSHEAAIRQVYSKQATVSTKLSGITIIEGWALARWQGKHDGGMVVFHRVDGEWAIVRGSGGSFTYQDLAFRLDVPEAIAKELIKQGAPEMVDSLPIVKGERP